MVQAEQFVVAVCIRPQPQIAKDESRITTHIKVRSDLKEAVVHASSKLANFAAKFCFRKRRRKGNANRQFHTFSGA